MKENMKDKRRDKRSAKECKHKNTKILKIYRKNYPFGRKSKRRNYEPPKLCKEVCCNCSTVLNRWKPPIAL